MYQTNQVGIAKRITAAGVTAISTVANVGIVGIACTPSVTGATTIQIWAGVTATNTAAVGSAGSAITGVITFASGTGVAVLAQYLRVPAYCSGGAIVNVAGDANPDITLFWNPL